MEPNGPSADAVVTSVADSSSVAASTAKDSIQEGKDKAKAIMAASGLDVSSSSPDAKNGEPSTKLTQTNERAVNGGSPSRKRSRSGSRKPKIPRCDELGVVLVETDTDKYRLQRYVERDSAFSARYLEVSDKIEKEMRKKDKARFVNTAHRLVWICL
jgi:SWI/SNF-related matrix-associated actin-dependent regulator of chromatin subfamily B member 1